MASLTFSRHSHRQTCSRFREGRMPKPTSIFHPPVDPVKCRKMYHMAKDVVRGYEAILKMAECISIPMAGLKKFIRTIEDDDRKRRKKLIAALIAAMLLMTGCQVPPAPLVSVTHSTNTVVWLHPSNEAKTNATVIAEQHTVFYLHKGRWYSACTNFPVATNIVEMRWHQAPRVPRKPLGLTNQSRIPFPPLPPTPR